MEILSRYTVLRQLSHDSKTYLCKEDATNRLLVIKRFQNERIPFFKKEAEALSELSSFDICPQLYFATSLENEAIIGMQYRTGKTLQEFSKESNYESIFKLKNKIQEKITILHNDYFYTHGDLNPGNIMIKKEKDKINICLLDWEFSEKIRNENINNYSKFRGTLGITPMIEENSLVNRDLVSVTNLFNEFFPTQPKGKSSILNRIKEWM